MPHLVAVSFGPVQDFIAAARRTRDLWFGSWALSEVSKAAAKALAASGARLIFPNPAEDELQPDSELAVANKLLAEVDAEPAAFVQRATEAGRTRWRKLADDARKALGADRRCLDEQAFDAQVGDLVEVYAAWVELSDNYAKDRKRVEEILAARKNTRDFAPVQWGGAGPKSSIDGLRESVLRFASPADEEAVRARLQLRPGEALSAVDVVKRFASRRAFPSTSALAALPLQRNDRRLPTEDIHAYVAAVERALGGRHPSRSAGLPIDPAWGGRDPKGVGRDGSRLDGEWLFEERVVDILGGEQGKAFVAAHLQPLLEKAGRSPSPYYAILVADGDHVGKWLDKLLEPRSAAGATPSGPDRHREASGKLARFARKAREIVENYGALVYAGGDDVLALVAADTVLDCAYELRGAFREAVGGDGPTLSAGIAVCHHLEPIAECLELARQAERVAKNKAGRDALAITLSKRGGVDRQISGKWDELPNRMRTWTELYDEERISTRAGHDLLQLAQELPPDLLRDSLRAAAQAAEAQRVLDRKRGDRGNRQLDKETACQVSGSIEQIGLRRTGEELIVAAELFRFGRGTR